MDANKDLTSRFEEERDHLRAVALRMLGSANEADDAVQEAWLRLSRADTSSVDNLGGWLTTVVARVCLDMLRSRKSRREDALGTDVPDPVAARGDGTPEHDALLADSVGPALLVVLETLAPAERLAFVLHDMFAVPFDEIARILGRSETATRQLASRGRRRVQGVRAVEDVIEVRTDHARERTVVDAFLAASRNGDFDALLAVLDPDVVVRADATAVRIGAASGFGVAPEIRGADDVARLFKGRAAAARSAIVDGSVGATWAPRGKPRVVFDFTIENGKIVAINLVADEAMLREIELEILADGSR